jgi:UDP-2-acetamido-3-amino-2,3-dideoxy-glucuronate N-acetyltransferase
MIGPRVKVGNGCKIQNNVSLYDGVELADDIFCGLSCVFTNVNNPRANLLASNASDMGRSIHSR